jgi:hypothetical protein
MTGADKTIRWSTAAAVIGVAVVAAVVSYEHAYALVRAHGETGWTARLIPLTVDGLIWASSMVSSTPPGAAPGCRRSPVGCSAWASRPPSRPTSHGLGNGPVGAAVGAWRALALVGSYELLMMIIRGMQSLEAAADMPEFGADIRSRRRSATGAGG